MVSYHSPILVDFRCGIPYKLEPFRLFKSVLLHLNFETVLQESWGEQQPGNPMRRIWQKGDLKPLNRQLASYTVKLESVRTALGAIQEQLNSNPLNEELILHERSTLLEIAKWSTIEEQVLRQKSRASWIKEEDADTK